jgi:nucleoside-diphosphate kinase
MLVPTADFIEAHYTLDPQWRKLTGEKRIKTALDKGEVPPSDDPIEISNLVLEKLRKYMTSGPVVAMVWEGVHVIDKVRKLNGSTEPSSSDVGTIRGDFVLDSYNISDLDNRSVRNLVHASSSPADAEKEINHWFKPEELVDYRLVQEQILYDVNLDGILE